jgi:ketosteroid isomerase-like protein
MSQENVEIVRGAFEAFSRRDVKAIEALLAPDCEIVPLRAAVDNTVFLAPDAAAKWFAAIDDSWETLSIEAETFRDGDDWVLALGRIQARGRSSGVDLDVQAAAVWHFGDGLITHIRVYTDRSEALADLGLAPEGS